MTHEWGRWHLSRGGVINIWEYGRETFDFSGGRVIFQGTNGSGKSRTLELLAPLCLDGDLRQMGSKGYDTVSMRRLMLDDYSGESTRIGYAWLELVRESVAGETEFLTCGIGVKASKNSGQISDSWRFITPRRIEHDVELAPEDMPLGPAQLRDTLGPGCVLDDEEFRARIAENVYLIPASRYGDLLHLQRTLRNPDIGVKVFDGHLENILSDALPPLDGSIVEQLATSFEDLHSIQDNLRQLQAADEALRGFLDSYAAYAASTLRDAGHRWNRASQARSRGRRELDALAGRISELTDVENDAAGQVTAAELRIDELDQLVSDLKSLPEFAELTDLGHQQRLADAARESAQGSLVDHERARAAQRRTADSVQTALDRLHDEVGNAQARADEVRSSFDSAGLDESLVPAVTLELHPSLREVAAEARTGLDAEPETVRMLVPPEIDFDELENAITAAMQTLDAAAAEIRHQAAVTGSLQQRAQEVDRSAAAVAALRSSADRAGADATDAAADAEQARADLAAAADSWHAAAVAWQEAVAAGGAVAVGGAVAADGAEAGGAVAVDRVAPPETPAKTVLVADAGAPRLARAEVDRWAADVRQRLHGDLHEATGQVSGLDRQLADVRAELGRLRAGQEPAATGPATGTDRDPLAGAAFYQLVDFAPSVSANEAAGVEAALAATGLLTAWVTADGTFADRDRQDVVAVAGDGAAAADHTLADLLVPAREPGCPVSESVVARLLSRIGVDALDKDLGDTGLTVSTGGRWQAGVLQGASGKESAEFIGAGARAAATVRRIAECEEQETLLQQQNEQAMKRRAERAETIAAWERRLGAFPDHEELVAAHTRTVDAAARAERLMARASELRSEHDEAVERVGAARATLDRDAAAVGLTGETAALAAARDAAGRAGRDAAELRTALKRSCLGGVAELRARCADHAAAADDLRAVTAEVERRCTEHRSAAVALAELTESVGRGAAELGERLRGYETEQRTVRRSLPDLRSRAGTATKARITAEAQRDARAESAVGVEQTETVAAEAFAAARLAPGVWSAAVAGGVEVPADPAAALRLLEKSGGAGGSEDAVLNSLQLLQTQLPATYAVAPEHHGEVLTVTVSGEDGRLPITDAAQRVATRLTECSDQLGQHYQDVLSEYLINDLSVSLSAQIGVAEDLYRRMNQVLDNARSSQGVHVQLQWSPSASLDETMMRAMRVIRTPLAKRSPDDEQVLRQVVIERIEAERESMVDSYVGILSRALDYRSWFDFSVIVRDFDGDGKARTRRFRNLSSGETRLISYVTLFAAAAAFYDALSSAAGTEARPLRLTLLDEAFERIDDPTIARMLGLLVDLDMDWIITWPSGWGISPKIPRMHIYDVLRPEKGRGIACAHTTWDGSGLAES